jgi:DNA-binding NarL/FixJ family response regulator
MSTCGGEEQIVTMAIRVAIIDDHEIFRRGLVACLLEDPSVTIVLDGPSGPVEDEIDVALTSPAAARGEHFACPVLVCGASAPSDPKRSRNEIVGFLSRSGLTSEQVIAAVRAAAAGLTVAGGPAGAGQNNVDERRLRVLQLLAQGASTLEISKTLRYSERTIKNLIQDVERELGAKSRAHAVAEGIRRGLI